MRLIEIMFNEIDREHVVEVLNDEQLVDRWEQTASDKKIHLKLLIEDEFAPQILNDLEKRTHFCRVVLYDVEATLPKPDSPQSRPEGSIQLLRFFSMSKEELTEQIEKPVNLSANFLLTVFLSSFVAGIGILENNLAVIIGAMVIAPFLGPNMSLAFGTTLGDWPIIRKSIVTGVVVTLLALGISILWGFLTDDHSNIALDKRIGMTDLVLALVCGFTGALSVISAQGSTLVGVMVAAALLPPLMRAGLLFGGAFYGDAFNSFLIFMANIVCLNISGIITFYVAGIRPGNWWEKELAKRKTKTAFLIWTGALLVIMLIILVLRKYN